MKSRSTHIRKRPFSDVRRLICLLLRRKIVWLCLLVITLPLFYLLNVVHDDKEDEFQLPAGSSEPVAIRNSKYKIVTITGRSYEAKISRLKVYRCNSSAGVVRPRSSDIRWNNKFWQSPTEGGLFLYSAYYDTRIRKVYRDRHCFIRILAMHDGELKKPYYCQIWMKNARRPIVIDADFTEIWFSEWDSQSQRRNYKPYVISCTLPRKFGKLKHYSSIYVSITTKPCGNATTILEAQQPEPLEQRNTTNIPDFVICVKPLDFDKDLSLRVVEWIELNFILGASKIDFYKFRVHPNVNHVLSYYSKLGKINVIPISLPGNQPNFPIERTQFLQRNLWQKRRDELIPYNDCLYRNIHKYDYVIPLDIDEVLTPRKHKTWQELFDYLQKHDSEKLNSFASFSVRNVYYLDSFGNVSEYIDADLYLLRSVYRSANFSNPGKSVKSFVRTDKTLSVFNHYALETVIAGIGRSTVLPIELIQMNHYRSKCPPTMSKECKANFMKFKIKDEILWKYKDELGSNVQKVHAAIFNRRDHVHVSA